MPALRCRRHTRWIWPAPWRVFLTPSESNLYATLLTAVLTAGARTIRPPSPNGFSKTVARQPFKFFASLGIFRWFANVSRFAFPAEPAQACADRGGSQCRRANSQSDVGPRYRWPPLGLENAHGSQALPCRAVRAEVFRNTSSRTRRPRTTRSGEGTGGYLGKGGDGSRSS